MSLQTGLHRSYPFLFASNSLSTRWAVASTKSRRGDPCQKAAPFLDDDINIKISKWILIFFFSSPVFLFHFHDIPYRPHVAAYPATHTFPSILWDLRICLSRILPFMNLFFLLQYPAVSSSPLLTFWWFAYSR